MQRIGRSVAAEEEHCLRAAQVPRRCASALAIAAALQTNDGNGSMKSLQREVIAGRWDDSKKVGEYIDFEEID